VIALLLLVLVVPLLAWLATLWRNRLLARPRLSGGRYAGAALMAALLPLLLLEGAAVLWASWAYDGICIGFTDGRWPCTRVEFTAMQAGYALFFLIPLSAFYVPAVGVIFGLASTTSGVRVYFLICGKKYSRTHVAKSPLLV